jgi:hypothetical protein
MRELARLYRELAQRSREAAESFRMWPDEAQALLREASDYEAKAAAAERGDAAD